MPQASNSGSVTTASSACSVTGLSHEGCGDRPESISGHSDLRSDESRGRVVRDTLSSVMALGIVGIVAAAAVCIALIAAGLIVRGVRKSRAKTQRAIDETRRDERRAVAYLEAALGWHAYLQTLRPLAFPEEGFTPNRQRDLAVVLRSRAQLEQFGSATVRQLHENALEEAVTLIGVLRTMPTTQSTGEPELAAGRFVLRFVLGEISKRVDALEREMNHELHVGTGPPEQMVELTGRQRVVETASPAFKRQAS